MSTVKTFLVLIFPDDWLADWREVLLLMDEEQAIFQLKRAGMNAHAEKRERHLFFELQHPLTREEVDLLAEWKRAELFLNFAIQDEITANIPPQQEGDA